MKTFLALSSLTLLFFVSEKTVHAEFEDLPNDSDAYSIDELESMEVEVDEYLAEYEDVFIHNNGEPIEKDIVSDYISGTVNFEDDNHLMGFSIKNEGIETDFHFSNITEEEYNSSIENEAEKNLNMQVEEENVEDLERVSPLEKMVENLEDDSDEIELLGASTQEFGAEAIDNHTTTIYDYVDSSVVAGQINSTILYSNRGTTEFNNGPGSVWDVKYENQMDPAQGYNSNEQHTRSSLEDYDTMHLVDHSPENVASGNELSISLTWGPPEVQWSFFIPDIAVTDYTSRASDYGRWEFDYNLGQDVSSYPHTTRPGIRAVNTQSIAAFSHSIYGDFYRNLSAQGIGHQTYTRGLDDL
ncbi:hypothetical protein [Alkalicoccus chagannorensis]|uniref:hypothetical protein n=1 Tax=Alkalicoccus chagannorensis TaxID=427072 RepID=UPI00041BF5A4|nr:hypothetical protein [Alkalicoccus chagannorensis]